MGKEADHNEQKNGKKQSRPHRNGSKLTNRLCPLLSPVLTAQYHKTVTASIHQLLKNKLDLINCSYTGQCSFIICPKHNIISQIDA